jgi:hypothetical protein
MEVIRQVENFILQYEPLQRMYQVTDGSDISFWMDSHDKDKLNNLSNFKFKKECEKIILNSLLEF